MQKIFPFIENKIVGLNVGEIKWVCLGIMFNRGVMEYKYYMDKPTQSPLKAWVVVP